MPVSFGAWRNLADGMYPNQSRFAHPQSLPPVLSGTSSLGLRPHERGARRGLGGTDAPERGHEEERQTAGGRVEGQCNPDRSGEGKRSRRRRQTNRCGQENQSCKHVPQPPREVPHQVARLAWQDCGRVRVNVRRLINHCGRCDTATVCRTAPTISAGNGPGVTQSRIEWPGMRCVCLRNILKRMDYFEMAVWVGEGCAARHRQSLCRDRGLAALWRKRVAFPGLRNQDVTEECLSFVMPQQHGTPVAAYRDRN